MTIQASILLKRGEFFAELSDGRQLTHDNLCGLAGAMHRAGVLAAQTQYEWRSGYRILTAGQQVALRAEMLRLEKEGSGQLQPAHAVGPARERVRRIALAA